MNDQNAIKETASAQSDSTARLEDGFYILTDQHGEDPCLVKLYTPNKPPVRGIGFGVWDGAGFVPLSDLRTTSRLIPVHIPEFSNVKLTSPPTTAGETEN